MTAKKKTTGQNVPNLSRRELLRLASQGTAEHPDPVPLEVPGKMTRPPTLREEMRRYVQEQISLQAEVAGHETFEESNDFEEENPDIDLLSPYTVSELSPEHEQQKDDLEGAPTPEDAQEPSQEATAPSTPPAEPPLAAPAAAEPNRPETPVQ